ncbi:MAG: Hpt domain-containing protein [Gemmatimonadales bacterium]
MTGPAGFLDFFILEASEYVERLDGLVLGAGAPDGDAVQRVARALRGTSTMAKLPAFAELAGAIERVGRALREGSLAWDQSLRGAVVSAVDDLKSLLHAARNWSSAEDERARARAAELARFAPPRSAARPVTPHGTATSPFAFLATESGNIAAGLELLTTRIGDAATAANLLRRIQALRGVAGVKEIGPLADTLEAAEEAVTAVQDAGDSMSSAARTLMESCAAYLRTIGASLRGGGADVNAGSPARDAFVAAQSSWAQRAAGSDRVVPIEELFYADGGPGLVEASTNPPTSSSDRFRLELVSLSEHLRQVVDTARHASDEAATVRARRDLQRALRSLQGAAESFGERDVADFIGGHVQSADHVDFLGLAALEDLSAVLAEPGAKGEHLTARLREISGGRDLAAAIGAGFGRSEPQTTPPAPAPRVPTPAIAQPQQRPVHQQQQQEPTPVSAPEIPRPTPIEPRTPAFSTPAFATPATVPSSEFATPASPKASLEPAPRPSLSESLDRASAALIDTSIAALDALTAYPFAEPTALPEDAVVPIETLLYRGRAALDRAVELRDEMRRTGPASNPEALDELFDLLELARAE